MDPCFYAVKQERCQVIVKEDYHHRPPHFFAMRSDDTSYGGGWPTMNVMEAGHGKQLPVLEATHNVNFHSQRPPVVTQVQYQLPAAQIQQVSLHYQPAHYDQQASQVPDPPVKKPATGKVIDSNEAARIYGGVVIKDFGRNNKLPSVRAF